MDGSPPSGAPEVDSPIPYGNYILTPQQPGAKMTQGLVQTLAAKLSIDTRGLFLTPISPYSIFHRHKRANSLF